MQLDVLFKPADEAVATFTTVTALSYNMRLPHGHILFRFIWNFSIIS
jgi:hypothetical protein